MQRESEAEAPYLVAEIGCNHCGDFERAKEMIRMAAQFCKVPAVKFQKRSPKQMLSQTEYSQPHPNPMHAYGPTYGAHREYLEFTPAQHQELLACCREWGLDYAASVWDLPSAEAIAALDPPFIKIPSACNTWEALAQWLCEHYRGELHVSLGMTTAAETETIVGLYEAYDRAKDLILYHCTSGYPVQFEEVNLLEIPALIEAYGDRVKGIGFSGHHLGIAVDVAAYALGARYFERHFTLDRTQKGTDHAASLEPDGLRRLWRDLNATRRAMHRKEQEILAVERVQRDKLKWDRNQ